MRNPDSPIPINHKLVKEMQEQKLPKNTIMLTDQEAEFLYDTLENNLAQIPTESNISKNMRVSLQGKILSRCKIPFDKIDAIRVNKLHPNNEFDTTPLFLGAGIHSENRISILHKRLQYAIYVLCGMEQNGGQGTEFDVESDKYDRANIKRTLIDIIAAFEYKPSDLMIETK